MSRKKKYENAEIVKGIIIRELHHLGDLQNEIAIRFLDLKKKEDRQYLKKQAEDIMQICQDAIKELEEN